MWPGKAGMAIRMHQRDVLGALLASRSPDRGMSSVGRSRRGTVGTLTGSPCEARNRRRGACVGSDGRSLRCGVRGGRWAVEGAVATKAGGLMRQRASAIFAGCRRLSARLCGLEIRCLGACNACMAERNIMCVAEYGVSKSAGTGLLGPYQTLLSSSTRHFRRPMLAVPFDANCRLVDRLLPGVWA